MLDWRLETITFGCPSRGRVRDGYNIPVRPEVFTKDRVIRLADFAVLHIPQSLKRSAE